MEEVVSREYEALVPSVDGFCGCPRCRDDVLVYALNRLPPRYVAQRTGEIVTNLAMQSDQERARISVVLLEGFGVVHADPQHAGESELNAPSG